MGNRHVYKHTHKYMFMFVVVVVVGVVVAVVGLFATNNNNINNMLCVYKEHQLIEAQFRFSKEPLSLSIFARE